MARRVLSILSHPWIKCRPNALLEEKHCGNQIFFSQRHNRDIVVRFHAKIHRKLLHLPCKKTKFLIHSCFHIIKFNMSNPAIVDVNVSLIGCDLIKISNQTFHGTFQFFYLPFYYTLFIGFVYGRRLQSSVPYLGIHSRPTNFSKN